MASSSGFLMLFPAICGHFAAVALQFWVLADKLLRILCCGDLLICSVSVVLDCFVGFWLFFDATICAFLTLKNGSREIIMNISCET